MLLPSSTTAVARVELSPARIALLPLSCRNPVLAALASLAVKVHGAEHANIESYCAVKAKSASLQGVTTDPAGGRDDDCARTPVAAIDS